MITYSKEGREHWFNGFDACYHPRYETLKVAKTDEENYRIERRFLRSLNADTVVIYLNGVPTTAEERLFTVEDIMAEEGWTK